ncbi:copper-translocating P-type ATPase [Methylopila jiangsuensis]|uniref:Copper-translocating P-type ATPase n=1 Tax=Methylopila jiangsuensis TaxID=586230 RepID=A0A9W6JJB5_9HYPH|nr:cation-translocating P-type ATPase [Methylopila jiangsuensis]MDR6287096.1 Cu+-exporting ATPase [Methylopila jiangsuensis]GLK76583.1 copper-translocating P-type ATPase [Methylopila jiangsuensis]
MTRPEPARAFQPADGDALTLDVEGMSCAACAARIEKVLGQTPGIAQAVVNLPLERADVRFSGPADAEAALAAVRRAGYDAHVRPADAAARRAADAERAEARQAEERRTLRLLAMTAVLGAPFVVEMVAMAFGAHGLLPGWLQLALATPVQVLVGARFYRGAYASLRGGAANMDVLVALGTTAAFGWSLAHVALGWHGPLYFEAAVAVLGFVLLGNLMQARAASGASAALTALSQLTPARARRARPDGGEEEVAVEALAEGDVVHVRPGERFPVDGVVRDGRSEADEQLVTGESRPIAKAPGDAVVAGALNGSGFLAVAATAVGEDATPARIARLVARAQLAKAPVQKLVDKVTAVFVPVVVGLSALTLVGWLLAEGDWGRALGAAIAVLVIACPCALGLATPAALVAGTGAAAKAGILVRDIEALERAARVDAVIFDKTGTLTAGRPALVATEALDGDGTRLLALAAAVERGSEHPLAHAVVEAAEGQGLVIPKARDIHADPGEGVVGEVDGDRVAVGSVRLLERQGAHTAPVEQPFARQAAQGRTVVAVSEGKRAKGVLAFADAPRPGAAEAVRRLSDRGVRVIMLTGDSAEAAAPIARSIGVSEVIAGARPADKLAMVQRLRGEGRHVAMVGDGVNDAPALAAADIGVAMGGGADVALETAGLALLRPDPLLAPAALDLARRTVATIRQNLVWAFAYNVIGLPLAALGLLSPAIAGGAMALSSASVVLNALRLSRWRPDR